jgi:hypothetical protein
VTEAYTSGNASGWFRQSTLVAFASSPTGKRTRPREKPRRRGLIRSVRLTSTTLLFSGQLLNQNVMLANHKRIVRYTCAINKNSQPSDIGNCSGYELTITICAINLARKRVNKSSEPNLQAPIEGTGDYHGSQPAGPSRHRLFCRVVSRNVDLGSPLQDQCFSVLTIRE